jgi:hypothetical protein
MIISISFIIYEASTIIRSTWNAVQLSDYSIIASSSSGIVLLFAIQFSRTLSSIEKQDVGHIDPSIPFTIQVSRSSVVLYIIHINYYHFDVCRL